MTWTVYRWDDASAPTLTGQAGTYDLITVLDACLVTGYGSKSAAGWTKPFTGTGKAAFRQGTGSNGRYLRVDCSASGQYPRLRGYDTMSDVDTGTNPVPTDAQISGGGYAYMSSTTDATQRAWVVFADAKRFYLWISPNSASSGAGTDTASAKTVYHYGDLESNVAGDAYNTLLICGTTGASTTNYRFGTLNNSVGASADLGHFIAGTVAQVAGSTTCHKRPGSNPSYLLSIMGAGGGAYPDPATTGLNLTTVDVHESAVFRGRMMGVYAPLHNLVPNPGDTLSGSASGGLNGKDFVVMHVMSGSTGHGRALFETSDTVG